MPRRAANPTARPRPSSWPRTAQPRWWTYRSERSKESDEGRFCLEQNATATGTRTWDVRDEHTLTLTTDDGAVLLADHGGRFASQDWTSVVIGGCDGQTWRVEHVCGDAGRGLTREPCDLG